MKSIAFAYFSAAALQIFLFKKNKLQSMSDISITERVAAFLNVLSALYGISNQKIIKISLYKRNQ
jgi:hypothetical protein